MTLVYPIHIRMCIDGLAHSESVIARCHRSEDNEFRFFLTCVLIPCIGAYSHTASSFQRQKQWIKLELEQLSVVSKSEGPETLARKFNYHLPK